MRYKKFMILAIFLVSLLAVSAVSAADNAPEDIVGVGETTDEVVNVENNDVILKENKDVGTFNDLANEINTIDEGGMLNLTKNYKYLYGGSAVDCTFTDNTAIDYGGAICEGTAVDCIFEGNIASIAGNDTYPLPDGTLTDLVNEIASATGELNLTRNYVFDYEVDDDYSEFGISINKQLVINGNGHFINSIPFTIDNYPVTFNDITFDTYAELKFNSNNNVLNNCNFTRIRYIDSSVKFTGSNNILNNCNFVKETWVRFTTGSDNVLNNCSFVNFNLQDYVVYFYNSNNNVINGCRFVDCFTSEGDILKCQGSNISILECSFNNCHSYDGPVISSCGSNNTIENCSFVKSQSSRNRVLSCGGSGYVIVNCSFDNCYSGFDSELDFGYYTGGIISCGGSDYAIVNCSFKNCHVKDSDDYVYGSGGAICLHGVNATVDNCSFVKCSADYGGAVYCGASNSTVSNCSFINCTAIIGGGIYYSCENCILINSHFKGNNAENYPHWYSKEHLDVINCTPMATIIIVSNVNTTYGLSEDLNIILTDGNNDTLVGQQVAILFNNEYYNKTTDENGQVSLPIPKLTPNTYTATISYKGNDDYYESVATADVVVNKADTQISAPNVSVPYKDTAGELVATITNTYGKALSVYVTVNLNCANYTVRADSKGKIIIPTKDLEMGNYTATFTYKGNANYNPSSTSANVVVTKMAIVIVAQDVSAVYRDPNAKLVATITDVDGNPLSVNLTVNLNKENYTLKSDSNGRISIPIGVMTPKTYVATISYDGNDTYAASSTTAKVTLAKADTVIVAPDVTVIHTDPNGKLVANITNMYGKVLPVNVDVSFNGENYTVRADSNGQIIIPTKDLEMGNYTATFTYKGNANYNPSSATANVVVTKIGTVIFAPNVNVKYRNPDAKLFATIIDVDGNPLSVNLTVNFNKQTYNVTSDSNGQISIPIGVMTPKTYVTTISYTGDDTFAASSTTAKVTLAKADTVIVAQDVSWVYRGNKSNLIATITNEYGKALAVNLDVNINGETYTVRADSNGQISVPVNITYPGSYAATISYKGNANYNPATTTANIIVKKANTTIAAPDVTVKQGDANGKLVARITNQYGNSIGVNLNININGETHTLRTDTHGKVSWPTENLAKGTYTATVTYAGNGNYNPTNTTTKITVK